MSETHIHRIGIVNGVKAQRKGDEVKYLTASVRFETELDGTYYGEEKRVDEIDVAIPANEGVNPGDVVILNISFKSPFGQRFQPALEVENPADELDEDAYVDA